MFDLVDHKADATQVIFLLLYFLLPKTLIESSHRRLYSPYIMHAKEDYVGEWLSLLQFVSILRALGWGHL